MRSAIRSLAILTILAASASPALGWGQEGHELICEIAFRELRPAARAEVTRLIAADSDYSTFSQSCIWPDRPRKRPAEHFLNVPRHYSYIHGAWCRLASTCLFTAIANDVYVLGSTADDRRKVEALKYVGHWVGDIHQPLHVSFKDDRGGNAIHEDDLPPCRFDLHSIWDTCIVSKRVVRTDTIADVATRLLASASPTSRSDWINSTVVDWADESLKITISPAVGYCYLRGGYCQYDTTERELNPGDPERTFFADDAYLDQHAPTVSDQILKAGIRLGALLNDVLDPIDLEDD